MHKHQILRFRVVKIESFLRCCKIRVGNKYDNFSNETSYITNLNSRFDKTHELNRHFNPHTPLSLHQHHGKFSMSCSTSTPSISKPSKRKMIWPIVYSCHFPHTSWAPLSFSSENYRQLLLISAFWIACLKAIDVTESQPPVTPIRIRLGNPP